MSVARLLKERERLEERLQNVNNAIQLLQELDGGAAAETKVRQLGKMVGIERPRHKPIHRDGNIARAVLEHMTALGNEQPLAAIARPFYRPGGAPAKENGRIFHVLLRFRRAGIAVKTHKGWWSLQPNAQALFDKKFSRGAVNAAKQRRSAIAKKAQAGPKNLAQTMVEPIEPPESLQGMPKDTPLTEALLAIAMHMPGDLNHFARAAVGLGVVENDWPRRRISVVLRSMVTRKLLKQANGSYALSVKGSQALNKLSATMPSA